MAFYWMKNILVSVVFLLFIKISFINLINARDNVPKKTPFHWRFANLQENDYDEYDNYDNYGRPTRKSIHSQLSTITRLLKGVNSDIKNLVNTMTYLAPLIHDEKKEIKSLVDIVIDAVTLLSSSSSYPSNIQSVKGDNNTSKHSENNNNANTTIGNSNKVSINVGSKKGKRRF